MTAPPDDTTTDTSAIIAALRTERDAALAREAALAEALATRTAELATRNSDYGERIEQQTATIDVLKALSASLGDAQPVFDLIVKRAAAFCEGDRAGLALLDGELLHLKSYINHPNPAAYEATFPRPVSVTTAFGRAILAGDAIQIPDTMEDANYQRLGTERNSMLGVPLLRAGKPIGAVLVGRPRPGEFSLAQVELLKTFAEQAVIAISSAETYRQLQTRTSDLQETLEYQTATSDVLKVISQSAFDLQPVLDTLVETAARLCDAEMASIGRREGELVRGVAFHGYPPEFRAWINSLGAMPLDRHIVGHRAVLEGRVVHVHDIAAEPNYPTGSIVLGKMRTSLAVPLLREGETVGAIVLARQRVEPFTDRQIELVSTFADQAVIAIENTRLITEQREALEQQTATAEVLQVINASPGELEPVFEAMLDRAMRLCEAAFGEFGIFDGERFKPAALLGVPAAYAAVRAGTPRTDAPGTVGRHFREGASIAHIADLMAEEIYQSGNSDRRSLVDLGGARTMLAVALRKDEALLGEIMIYRQEVRPFSDRQIALLQNFAAQAVIAMENARLITEQREALEQQTATAEVLGVINASPGNLAPVFDAILEKAHNLCGVTMGALLTYDGHVTTAQATRGYSEQLDALVRQPRPLHLSELVQGDRFLHIPDMAAPEFMRGDFVPVFVEQSGARTYLAVALRKDGRLIGMISAIRTEVRPFSDKEITLLENFAAQAVIAMENARLITEQREALEQQTATAEVLQVINASPGDLAPVFDTILEKAHNLCGAEIGALLTYDGDAVRLAAERNLPPAWADVVRGPWLPRPDHPVTRLIRGERLFQIEDMAEIARTSDDPVVQAAVELGGIRSLLLVPLRKDGDFLGYITAYRQEVRPFTDKEIALLESFAAQAVIAMENARLLGELRQRTSDLQETLEYQTATSDVLKVISRSTFDLQPVLSMVAETTARLCATDRAAIFGFEGGMVRLAANFGFPPEYQAGFDARGLVPLNPGSPGALSRAARERRAVHVRDAAAVPGYPEAALKLGNVRTALGVPLLREGEPIGVIVLSRQRVEPFTDRQIELVSTFADQAVIAIENTRLITEQREALEQQTATAEVLQVINASPGNLTPVFEAILEKAHRLCGATLGSIVTFDGEYFRAEVTHGYPEHYAAYIRRGFRADAEQQALVDGKRFVHIADLRAAGPWQDDELQRAFIEATGVRTYLVVPLRKDGNLLGLIGAHRQEAHAFTDKEITLLENFAAQAVIAMENARLINEQREALEQQTATAEVLQVINASPGNLMPVFDTILAKALRLCEAAFGSLVTYDGECFQVVATRGLSVGLAKALREREPLLPSKSIAYDQIVRGADIVHIPDITATGTQFPSSPNIDQDGARTTLFVALRGDDALFGAFVIYRKEVRLFSDKQIALLKNFAAQAVIAMANARLLNEQREALERQTATAEVLQVINSSPGDLGPVFAAILEKALRLCEAQLGGLFIREGERFHAAATRGLSAEFDEFVRQPLKPGPNITWHRAIAGEDVVHVTDIAAFPMADNPLRTAIIERGGARTLLQVALRKEDVLLGVFSIFRQEVRPFTGKQIALVQSFAAQAVIAMENARLLDEIRQRQEELRITFENMGDGVAMFDETPRLVAWNRKFQEIFNVPDALLDEHRTYAEYIRYLGARGDFGPTVDVEEQIRRFTETAGEHHAYERIRPDGRVIEIRHNPVAGGGFVLIYADITERKRSEAEIRAARDAAEEASRTIEAAYRDLKAAQANLIQAEKMASLGQLTAGIAHEIKNPLNFVNNFSALSTELIDELRDVLAPEPLGETARTEVNDLTALLKGNLEKVVQHGQRADGIVRSMLDHSRGSSGERRMVDLNALIDEALNLAYHGARAQDQSFNVALERDFGQGIAAIEVNPQDITRVFLNLFANGFYATTRRARDGGDAGFVPTLKVTTRDAGETVEVRVRDNGTGIPADIRDKLFQPFFTTKPTGEGTGLGLSITYDIVTQQHGGSIAVDSKVGDYSEFTIRLPRKP